MRTPAPRVVALAALALSLTLAACPSSNQEGTTADIADVGLDAAAPDGAGDVGTPDGAPADADATNTPDGVADADGGPADVPVTDVPVTDVPTNDVPVADTPVPDATIEVDEGPGLGIDYSTTGAGVTPRFELAGTDWLAIGWPTDRLLVDGKADLSSFPNPNDNALLQSYLDVGNAALDGWGLNSSVYFEFDGELDMTTMPSAVETQNDPAAPLQLVNVTPTSPRFGQQWPIVFRWFGDEPLDPFTTTNSLAMRPVFGRPLWEAETYCAIVTRAARDTDGNYLSQSAEFAANLDTEPSLQPLVFWLQNGALLNRDDVASATCFTTQDATGELRKARDLLDTLDTPDLDSVEEPVVWGEFHGTYTAPNFQSGEKPYAEVGGDLELDAAGVPIIQEQETIRFLLIVPKDKPMPAEGWPVVHYAHGTGGDYESCRGRAPILLDEGLALLCIDQPLHGIRGPNGEFLNYTDLVLYSFNFLNGAAGRMSFRQAAIDSMTLNRMIVDGKFDLGGTDTIAGQEVKLDPDKIYFFGHSHGGTSGALLMGVDPIPKAAVLSGAAGVLVETILRRTDPTDLKNLVKLALGVLSADIDAFHPALSLVQTLVDTTDPVNYSPYWLSPKGGGPGAHIFMTEGIEDHASPAVGADALGAAGQLPLVNDLAKVSESHELQGLPILDLPVSLNVGTGADARTAALKQYQEGDHWVALDHPEAQALWREFFRTLVSDTEPVTLGLGDQKVTGGSSLAAGESCADAGVIDPSVLPVEVIGDTTLAADDYSSSGCGGNDQGAGRRDQAWSFTATEDGNYRFRVTYEPDINDKTPRPKPNRVYLTSDCADIGSSCLASGTDNTLSLTTGETVFIIVDGVNLGDKGSYKLTVSQSCQELDCGSRECGNWGCGSCGDCGSGEFCDADGMCQAAGAGDSCADPIAVGSLPFTATGNTNQGFDNLYGYQAGDCPGVNAAYGNGSAEVVYSWNVPTDGLYDLTLDADYPGNLYIVEDCADIAGSCLGGDRRGGGEFVQLDLTAGQQLFVIVDGYLDSSDEGAYALRIDQCQPQCEDKACGGDGCGGSCGSCEGATRCVSDTSCVPFPEVCTTTSVCEPIVQGDTCDDPFVVDALPYSHGTTTSTMYNEYGYSANSCPGQSGERGKGSNDTAYAFTPPSTAIYRIKVDSNFDSNLYVVTDCDDVDNTCIIAREDQGKNKDEVIFPTLNQDEQVFIIVDGRNNSSNLAGSYTLTVSECTPNCTNKQCGSDGCGGTCGSCGQFESCSGGQCVTTLGYSCEVPRNVGGLPYKHDGNTGSFDSQYSNACEATVTGDASPNVVYQFSPSQAGPYTAWVTASWDAQLYAVTDCSDMAGSCVAGPGTKSLDIQVADGETVYFIVDGAPAGTSASGGYTFRVDNTCFADCTDKNCGSDGCGGSCGTCSLPADLCIGGTCTDPATIEGNACATPFVVDQVPFSATGDTSDALNHYGIGDGQCPGFSEKGRGSNDQAWSFTAPADGNYRVDVFTDEDWDAAIYVATDCAALAETCVASGDGHHPLPNSATVSLTSGQTVFIVVDGADNIFNDAGAYTLQVVELP